MGKRIVCCTMSNKKSFPTSDTTENIFNPDFQSIISSVQFSSVLFSRSVVSNSLQPHDSQHVRPPYPSQTPRVYSNSCPLSWWCHPAISSSVVPFSSCPQSLPASGSFPISQLFTWGGQSIGVSAIQLSSMPLSEILHLWKDWEITVKWSLLRACSRVIL